MEQLSLMPVLHRLDAPGVVHPDLVRKCKTYREAVQLCWELRRVRNMKKRSLAEATGLYASHISCYLAEKPKVFRDLPASGVRAFEWALGNTAISQWHGMNARLTNLEEMQLLRSAA